MTGINRIRNYMKRPGRFEGRIVLWAVLMIRMLNNPLRADDLVIQHTPVGKSTSQGVISIEASLQPGMPPEGYIWLYYRSDLSGSYEAVELKPTKGGTYQSEIQVLPNMNVIEYFLLLVVEGKKVATSPPTRPYTNPYRIDLTVAKKKPPANDSVPLNAGEYSTIVPLVLSPEPESQDNTPETVVAISFLKRTSEVDLGSVELMIDGVDVTSQGELTPFLISIAPASFSEGKHRVSLHAYDVIGKPLRPIDFAFWVGKRKLTIPADRNVPLQLDVEDAYQQALNEFYFRNYQRSIDKLYVLLEKYPTHHLVSNFQYWIGENYYGLKKYLQAIEAFEKVSSYRKSTKHDDALIMLGMCYRQLGKLSKANKQFRQLIRRHPDSEYVALAKRFVK